MSRPEEEHREQAWDKPAPCEQALCKPALCKPAPCKPAPCKPAPCEQAPCEQAQTVRLQRTTRDGPTRSSPADDLLRRLAECPWGPGIRAALAGLPGSGGVTADPHGVTAGVEVPLPLERGRDDHLNAVAGVLLVSFRTEDDVEAYGLLVELTQARLVELARGLLHRQSALIDPDDLVASFLAGLFTDVRKQQPRVRHFLALAYTVMRYDVLNQVRLRQRAARRHETWEQRRLIEGRPLDPADVLDQRERTVAGHQAAFVFLAVVSEAFLSLADRDREVLRLRELERLAYDQLAEALGVPRTQVGMVLKRARERLACRVQRRLAEVPPIATLAPVTRLALTPQSNTRLPDAGRPRTLRRGAPPGISTDWRPSGPSTFLPGPPCRSATP